jgi:HK97 gp10 family phage protein
MLELSISGIERIEKAIKDKEKALVDGVQAELKASALTIEKGAKRNAPVNFGRLRQSITSDTNGLSVSVDVEAHYAPYVEFGTGGRVNTQGFDDVANRFKGKGKGGAFKEMLEDLADWVKKKGIARGKDVKNVAYVIAVSILRKGIKPQPYLFPAYTAEKPKLLQRLKKLLG